VGFHLRDLVEDFAMGLVEADAQRPQHISRSGRVYKEGIGPHNEDKTVELVLAELERAKPERYEEHAVGVQYPGGSSRQKCDLCIGNSASPDWAVEIKMLRLLGDNGKPNDNMLMHILSPILISGAPLLTARSWRTPSSGRTKRSLFMHFITRLGRCCLPSRRSRLLLVESPPWARDAGLISPGLFIRFIMREPCLVGRSGDQGARSLHNEVSD
jgi:hypothetical protein